MFKILECIGLLKLLQKLDDDMPDKRHSNKPQKSKHDKVLDKKKREEIEKNRLRQSVLESEPNLQKQKKREMQKTKISR